MNQTGGIVAILGGVALIYLAYTGYLDSTWKGLRGQCSGAPAATAKAGAGPASGSNMRGRGRGGAVNVNYRNRGTMYPSATGGLMAGQAGSW